MDSQEDASVILANGKEVSVPRGYWSRIQRLIHCQLSYRKMEHENHCQRSFSSGCRHLSRIPRGLPRSHRHWSQYPHSRIAFSRSTDRRRRAQRLMAAIPPFR